MIEDIIYYTHNNFGPQRCIERHEIKFHELTFLLEGEMTYYIDDEAYPMVGGDIIYVPAGSVRQRHVGDISNHYVSVNFHSLERLPIKLLSHAGINKEIMILISYFDAIYETPSVLNQKKLAYVLETLALQISDNLSEDEGFSLAMGIRNYLAHHYHEKITLEDISRETFFSTAYCESEFRKLTGKSIIHYLIDLRVGEAKKLLAETSMSCSSIATVVGFDDANYFSRVFKKRTGYSPLKYRAIAE